jgi:hypothetical protein
MNDNMKGCVWAICLSLAACDADPEAAKRAEALEVNIQVTGVDNVHAMMTELDRRTIVATVWLAGAEMGEECRAVEAWALNGHEIAGKFGPAIDDETPRQAQEDELSTISEMTARCRAGEVGGFRANRFTFNQDTYELLDARGYRYLERSARAERYSVYSFKPYPLDGHSFAILPMPIVVYYGETASMCDNACEDMMSPAELLQYEKRAIDVHLRTREPLIFEWHPGTTYPDDEIGWWSAFTGLLDHLESLDPDIEFVTARELVERYATQ